MSSGWNCVSSAFDNNYFVFMLKPFCIYVTGEINLKKSLLVLFQCFGFHTSADRDTLQSSRLNLLIDNGWGNKTEEEQSFEKEGQAIRTDQGGVWLVVMKEK